MLKRFTKPSHLFAKGLSLVVGDLVFVVVGLRCFLEDIEPFRTPRLGPAQRGMVAALLGKQSLAPSGFFLPTSLNELGLNLAEAPFERNPLSLGQTESTRL